MASWTPATTRPAVSQRRTIIGKHRPPKKTPVREVVDVDVWANYASEAKKATGASLQDFASFLCIPTVQFVGGVACIPADGIVSASGRSGLGFANRMVNNGVPDAVARAWEGVVSSAVGDYFRSFQIFLTYPSFFAHPAPSAGPTPNVPVSLSQGSAAQYTWFWRLC